MDPSTREHHGVLGPWGVRYQVNDVQRSIHFYTHTLGFNLDRQNLPAFGQVSIGDLKLILSGPGTSGSRAMPDGRQQEPGGWNRVVLRVKDLPALIRDLEKQGSTVSQQVGNRSWRQANSGGRSGRQSDRVVRACLAVKQWLHLLFVIRERSPQDLSRLALEVSRAPQGVSADTLGGQYTKCDDDSEGVTEKDKVAGGW